MRPSSRQAFTLIELLVVIVIIAILLAISIPMFLVEKNKAHDVATQATISNAFKEIRAQYSQRDAYVPADVNDAAVSSPDLKITTDGLISDMEHTHITIVNVNTVAVYLRSLSDHDFCLVSKEYGPNAGTYRSWKDGKTVVESLGCPTSNNYTR